MYPESVRLVGTGSVLVMPDSNCQMPFRLSQFDLTICGLGYSGSGVFVSTWLVHGVVNGGCFICHPPASASVAMAAIKIHVARVPIRKLRPVIDSKTPWANRASMVIIR